jgi:tetratricopeptide (TPR) repeat protein
LDRDLSLQFTVPHLEDSDIDLLLDALDNANRLGKLKGLNTEERRDALEKRCGRQLLIAMIEATSGERFDHKVEVECRELGADLGLAYAIAALAHNLREWIARDELLLAMGGKPNEALNSVQRLLNQHLLVQQEGRIRLRHRLIAERAIEFFRQEGQLAQAIRGLMFTMATKGVPERQKRSRERHILTALLSHSWLYRMVGLAPAREAYDEVEDLLSWDFHYWLQRGSLEVQHGDLTLAQNFLEQAHALEPSNYMVETEWAYMVLKKACLSTMSPEVVDRAEAAFVELEDAIRQRGRSDTYPYHVLGSQGLSWVRRAGYSLQDRVKFLRRIRGLVKEGAEFHPRNTELKVLAQDVEKEYLMLAVGEESR